MTALTNWIAGRRAEAETSRVEARRELAKVALAKKAPDPEKLEALLDVAGVTLDELAAAVERKDRREAVARRIANDVPKAREIADKARAEYETKGKAENERHAKAMLEVDALRELKDAAQSDLGATTRAIELENKALAALDPKRSVEGVRHCFDRLSKLKKPDDAERARHEARLDAAVDALFAIGGEA